ncbi:MAG: hypothetical protein ACYST9_02120 [Planctomycetota bacterium]|jgi:HEAT repeat protein
MKAKWFYLALLIFWFGCQPAEQQSTGSSPDKDQLAIQLKINSDALIKGTSEEIRFDAASILLFSDNPLARKMLLEAVNTEENTAGRVAFCKALTQARYVKQTIGDKDDFIEPLFNILKSDSDELTTLAAEAILIFDYNRISWQFEKIVTDESLPSHVCLNAIKALKLQPDMRAIFLLINLSGDSRGPVAFAAEEALLTLGIPVGRDAQTRKDMIEQLKRKGPAKFQRDWLIRQETKIIELENQQQLWQQLYLEAIGKVYDRIDTDEERGSFLIDYLNNTDDIVRLWALDRVSQWRMGTKSKMPAELGPILLELISDTNRQVRLETANLLALMSELDSAQKLTDQIKLEQDQQVRLELFGALGGACYYAALPNSSVKIPQQIRKQTLDWAAEYLACQETEKVQRGAEVIKRLLEHNGLENSDVESYFSLLAQRYQQARDQDDGALKGELLGAMAGLCVQSVYNAEAVRIFEPLFEQGLLDGNDLVRQAAVDGLIYIDKSTALSLLRKDFINDQSPSILKKLIGLVSEIGTQEDLAWLTEKMKSESEGESAWQAMLRIFKRSDADIVTDWLNRFDTNNKPSLMSYDQRITLLVIAEGKALSENKLDALKTIRKKFASTYYDNAQYPKAAEYLGLLRETAESAAEKDATLAALLDAYLKWPNSDSAVVLIKHCLLAGDLDPNSAIVTSIDDYLAQPSDIADPNVLTDILKKIPSMPDKPKWTKLKARWAKKLQQPNPKQQKQP